MKTKQEIFMGKGEDLTTNIFSKPLRWGAWDHLPEEKSNWRKKERKTEKAVGGSPSTTIYSGYWVACPEVGKPHLFISRMQTWNHAAQGRAPSPTFPSCHSRVRIFPYTTPKPARITPGHIAQRDTGLTVFPHNPKSSQTDPDQRSIFTLHSVRC